jgi:hypothetical protein
MDEANRLRAFGRSSGGCLRGHRPGVVHRSTVGKAPVLHLSRLGRRAPENHMVVRLSRMGGTARTGGCIPSRITRAADYVTGERQRVLPGSTPAGLRGHPGECGGCRRQRPLVPGWPKDAGARGIVSVGARSRRTLDRDRSAIGPGPSKVQRPLSIPQRTKKRGALGGAPLTSTGGLPYSLEH